MKIEFVMPGKIRQHVIGLPESYRITVERDDGMATSEVEAWTAMSMLCSTIVRKKKRKEKTVATTNTDSVEILP